MKRVIWFAIGAGSSVWAQRSAKKRLEKYTPPAAVERAKRSGTAALRTVKDAVNEGRAEAASYRESARKQIRDSS